MPNLQMLHLSGNWIVGSIAADVRVSASLQELSLSFNQIFGAIPTAIQMRPWNLLDLSFNQFDGMLSDKFAPIAGNASVSLEMNRLSGIIPIAFNEPRHVKVLQGNLFSCGVDRRDLSRHDPYRKEYNCGSNDFEVSFSLWGFFVVVLLAVRLISVRWDKANPREASEGHFEAHTTNSRRSVTVLQKE